MPGAIGQERKRLLTALAEAAKVVCRPRHGLSMVTYDALRQAALVATYQYQFRNATSGICWGTWNGLRVFEDATPMETYLEALNTAILLLKADSVEAVLGHEEDVTRLVAEFAVLEKAQDA